MVFVSPKPRRRESGPVAPSAARAARSRSGKTRPPLLPGSRIVLILAIVLLALGVTVYLATRSRPLEGPSPGNVSPGQVIDGIPCQTSEQVAYHVHPHLTILVNGQDVAVPAAIGIGKPWHVETGGFVGGGSCLFWLHTHDATGIIHVEAPAPRGFTLGEFFDIWGQPLTATDVAGHAGKVTAYIDQRPVSGDPRAIPLTNHESIVLEVGTPVPPPPNFDFTRYGL